MALVRRSLREQVRDALLRDIIGGVYRPGDRLVEMKIARDLGTSQAPVREAMRDLAALGFVETGPNRGTFVGDVWRRGLHEIYAVRGGLEELATRLATPALAADAAPLLAAIDEMRAAARAGDIDGIVSGSYRFHRAIVEASGNQLLLNVWDGLNIETRTTITLMAPGLDLMEIAESHQPIVEAIASGDVELACRVAREHQQFFERLPEPDPAARARRAPLD